MLKSRVTIMKPLFVWERLVSCRESMHKIAPLAGFRNILIHEYLEIDWGIVFEHLQALDDLAIFIDHIKQWLKKH
jgi:uncharacterized protein YutE (UPF0331/DUF86 family)